MTGVKVVIVRYTDPSQPGWVECTLKDACGQDWTFVEKVPVVSSTDMDEATRYPQAGVIPCEVVGHRHDADGRRVFTIDTDKLCGVASTTGRSQFDVFSKQLTVLPSPFLWDAFTDDAQFKLGSRVVRMICREIGAINLPTGRIVVCDPFVELHTRYLNRRVNPEWYGAFLAVADFGHDQRVAAAMILFADDITPIRWEIATEAGDPSGNDGLSVDSAYGCFMDRQLARFLCRKTEKGQFDRYERLIRTQIVENDRPTWSWANAILDETSGTNIIAFTTGIGDGSYPSFFGFGSDGRLVCLTTDFGLLDEVTK